MSQVSQGLGRTSTWRHVPCASAAWLRAWKSASASGGTAPHAPHSAHGARHFSRAPGLHAPALARLRHAAGVKGLQQGSFMHGQHDMSLPCLIVQLQTQLDYTASQHTA